MCIELTKCLSNTWVKEKQLVPQCLYNHSFQWETSYDNRVKAKQLGSKCSREEASANSTETMCCHLYKNRGELSRESSSRS